MIPQDKGIKDHNSTGSINFLLGSICHCRQVAVAYVAASDSRGKNLFGGENRGIHILISICIYKTRSHSKSYKTFEGTSHSCYFFSGECTLFHRFGDWRTYFVLDCIYTEKLTLPFWRLAKPLRTFHTKILVFQGDISI